MEWRHLVGVCVCFIAVTSQIVTGSYQYSHTFLEREPAGDSSGAADSTDPLYDQSIDESGTQQQIQADEIQFGNGDWERRAGVNQDPGYNEETEEDDIDAVNDDYNQAGSGLGYPEEKVVVDTTTSGQATGTKTKSGLSSLFRNLLSGLGKMKVSRNGQQSSGDLSSDASAIGNRDGSAGLPTTPGQGMGRYGGGSNEGGWGRGQRRGGKGGSRGHHGRGHHGRGHHGRPHQEQGQTSYPVNDNNGNLVQSTGEKGKHTGLQKLMTGIKNIVNDPLMLRKKMLKMKLALWKGHEEWEKFADRYERIDTMTADELDSLSNDYGVWVKAVFSAKQNTTAQWWSNLGQNAQNIWQKIKGKHDDVASMQREAMAAITVLAEQADLFCSNDERPQGVIPDQLTLCTNAAKSVDRIEPPLPPTHPMTPMHAYPYPVEEPHHPHNNVPSLVDPMPADHHPMPYLPYDGPTRDEGFNQVDAMGVPVYDVPVVDQEFAQGPAGVPDSWHPVEGVEDLWVGPGEPVYRLPENKDLNMLDIDP